MSKFNFEKFVAVGGKFVVRISIAKPGGLSMSSGFYSTNKMTQYQSADLYYDKEEKVIAIKVFKDMDEGSFKIKHRDGGKGGYISAISFIKSYGIDRYFGKKIKPETYNDENIGQVFLLKIDQVTE